MTARICSVPWQEIWINPELKYGLCCKENQHLIEHSDAAVPVEQHWNRDSMIDVRQRFLAGNPVPECQLCWQNEQDGKTSMRMRRNVRYLGATEADVADLARLQQHLHDTDLVEGLNLSCGNLCQLRCITCNPSYSRSIKKDYDKLGWTHNQKTRFNTANSTDRASSLSIDHIQALKLVTPQLKWIAVAGGEPTISRPLQQYLTWCIDQGHNEHIRLLITTNGVNVKQQFLDIVTKFQQVSVTVSVDGYGPLDEYLRYPGNWQKKLSFIDTCASQIDDIDLHSVVYGFNVLAINRLLDFSSQRGIRHSLEYIIWPNELCVGHLPEDLRDLAIQRLGTTVGIIESRHSRYRTQSDFDRTIECVRAVISHCDVAGASDGWHQMQSMMRAYDSIRPTRLSDHVQDLLGRY